MTAKPAGPLCMFACIICVFIESLPMDVLHANSIYLSLLASSVSMPPTPDFSLPAAVIYSLSLVSFVRLNAAFSILPRITTLQNGFASTTSKNLSTFCGCKLCFSFFMSFSESLCAKFCSRYHLHFYPSRISIVLPFSKMFLQCTHTSSCVRTATRCLNRKQQIHLRHHIKARICSYTDSAQGSEADYVSDAVCMLTA